MEEGLRQCRWLLRSALAIINDEMLKYSGKSPEELAEAYDIIKLVREILKNLE